MASNNYSIFLLPLVFLVVASSVSADADLSGLLTTLSNQGSVASLQEGMQCMQKLLPCKSYLNVSSNSVPTEMCCSSLKEMVSNDFECLCRFYSEPQILQSLNITRHDARQLPKACHVRLRLSKCKHEASPPAETQTQIPIPTDPVERQEAAAAVLAAVSSSSQYVPAATTTSSSSSASTEAISYLAVVAVASAPFLFIH